MKRRIRFGCTSSLGLVCHVQFDEGDNLRIKKFSFHFSSWLIVQTQSNAFEMKYFSLLLSLSLVSSCRVRITSTTTPHVCVALKSQLNTWISHVNWIQKRNWGIYIKYFKPYGLSMLNQWRTFQCLYSCAMSKCERQ